RRCAAPNPALMRTAKSTHPQTHGPDRSAYVLLQRSCGARCHSDGIKFCQYRDAKIPLHIVTAVQSTVEEQFVAERSSKSEQHARKHASKDDRDLVRLVGLYGRRRAAHKVGGGKHGLIVAVQPSLIDGLRGMQLQLQFRA